MPSSFLDRKETHFVLWRPGPQQPPPKLVIGVGVFKAGSPPALSEERSLPMAPAGESGDLAHRVAHFRSLLGTRSRLGPHVA